MRTEILIISSKTFRSSVIQGTDYTSLEMDSLTELALALTSPSARANQYAQPVRKVVMICAHTM